MPEVVGSAVYQLDLDDKGFRSKLVQDEAQLKSSTARMDAVQATSAKQFMSLADKKAASIEADARRYGAAFATMNDADKFALVQAKALEEQWGISAVAAGQLVGGAAQVGGAVEKTAKTTTKLSGETKVLNNALRTSASQFAQAIPGARGLSSAFGAAAIQMPLLAGGILGGVLAFELLDMGVKHFTGSGLIDYLTGAAAAHEKAAQAARDQADVEDKLSRFAREGASKEQALPIIATEQIDSATKKWADYRIALEAATKAAQANTNKDTLQAIFDIKIPDLTSETNQILNLKLNYQQLLDVKARAPQLVNEAFVDELARQRIIVGELAASTADWAISINAARKAQSEFTGALGDLQSLADVFDPQTAAIELEIERLTQMKAIMGAAFGDQAELDAFTGKLGILKSQQEIVTKSIALFGAEVRDKYGALAPAMIQNVTQLLAQLPTEQKIQLAILLPNLVKIQSAFAAFIAALQAGASITVAVRIAGAAAFPNTKQQPQGREARGLGTGSEFQSGPLTSAAQAFIDEQNKLIDSFNAARNAEAGLTGGTNAAGGAAAGAAKETQIWADNIISLSEAMAEGLNPAQVAQLENTHDAEMAAYSLADALFRQQVESEKAARGGESLQIALVEIATELIKSKRTLEEWNLDEILRPKLDAVRSMIDDIFNQPTKESLALDLKKAKLEREALLLERGGADASKVGQKGTKDRPAPEASANDKHLKSINDQIEAISREIDLRRKDFEIAKLETELKDKTVASDVDILNANQFLATALTSLSGDAKTASDALGIRLFDAALKAASGLQAVGAAGGTGFTPAERHWINGVAFNAGEPPPFPGFKWGLDFVPRDNMPALLHYGERVLTRQENVQMSQGGGDVHLTINGIGRSEDEIMRIVDRKGREGYRRARGIGASALPSSHVPG